MEQNFNINPSQLKLYKCTNCEGKLFESVTAIGRVPKLSIASPNDVIVPIPIWRCVTCGEILHSLIPPGIKFDDDPVEDKKENDSKPPSSIITS
jgi:DNA-directed RNA polymerase subunit RPC12/RpoP